MNRHFENNDRLTGKVAVITGAARGTGAELARFFVQSGSKVVIADILDDMGEQLAAELGDAAYFQHLDVTSQDDWEAAIPEAESRFGAVNVLVNNAAILHLATIADTSPEDFRRVLDVNLVGPMLGIRAVTPAMRRSSGGSIVNVASIDALDPHIWMCMLCIEQMGATLPYESCCHRVGHVWNSRECCIAKCWQ